MQNKILIINGSPQGRSGNSEQFVRKYWPPHIPAEQIYLCDAKKSLKTVFKKMQKAPAIVFITGTYWDSWGSPLQYLLEQMTPYEGCKEFVGKPVSAIVLMHSVGGKAILSRLQGVLNTYGFLIPPMSGMVYSLTNHLALKKSGDHHDDLWHPQDLEMILQNLLSAAELTHKIKWTPWPVDRKDPRRLWLK